MGTWVANWTAQGERIMKTSMKMTLEHFDQRLTVKRAALVGLSALVLFGSVGAKASEKMDSKTHSIVIEKLETALSKAKEDETIDLAPVRSRLADLYADRARLMEMEEIEKGCQQNCGGSAKQDRMRALALYEIVVRETPAQQQGPMSIHMAHLYHLVEKPKRSENIYERLIAEGSRKHVPEVLSQAYAGRAELRYSRAEFKRAQGDFEAALKLAPPHRRGHIAHRIGWCHLNQGDQETAVAMLMNILKNENLLKREAGSGAKVDLAFQEEVAMDLGTFIARGHVTERDVRTIESLAPEKGRVRVVRHFANETERLGQQRAALAAWALTAELEPSKEEQLEIHVRVARLHYDLGEKQAAVESMRRAVDNWRDNGCKKAGVDCDNMRKRLKNLVTDWNKAERKKPTPILLDAYVVYVSHFNDDVEMMFFAAQVAREVKNHSVAADLFHKTSLLAVKSKLPQAREILETSLAAEIEMAEQAPKDKSGFELRAQAYDYYLKMAPQGRLSHSVRYQRARLPYEQGQHDEASRRLETFAKSDACKSTAQQADRKLCLQAADLDLDARVLLKDDRSIEKGALTYARLYPEQKLEYLKIARTSAMKQSQTMDPEDAIEKLASIDTTGMDHEERLRLLKTRLALAEKAKDLGAVRSAGRELLALKNLNEKDQEFALSRLAWAAEMAFDFKTAYQLSLKMEMKNLKPADRELRLSMFAELAGQNAKRHDEAFLALSRNSSQRAAVRAKMVRNAGNMYAEYRRHEGELKRHPKLAAPLVLEIFAKTGDRRFAEAQLKNRAIAREAAGRALARQLFLTDFMKIESRLANHKIRTRSDRQMQNTLTERLNLIGQAETSAAKAIKSADWTAQLVGLSVLSRENKRLHGDVLALPVPKQLKGEQRIQYMKQVEAHANTFLAKHQAIEQKLQAFWKDEAALNALVTDFETARPSLRKLMSRELSVIAKVAPESNRGRIDRALRSGVDQPAATEVASAVNKAKEKPFNTSRLEILKELEQSRGRETMVVYLDARLSKLKEEARQ